MEIEKKEGLLPTGTVWDRGRPSNKEDKVPFYVFHKHNVYCYIY